MRRFEFHDDGSHKFWEVRVETNEVVVRFGRVGSKGQERRTACADAEAARGALDRLVREKTSKGYVESAESGVKAARAVAPSAPKTKRPAKARSASASSATWPTHPTPREQVRCFRPEDDVLFARGFPQMHVLTDATVTKASAIAAARVALDAIDPRLPVEVPRDVARRFVMGHRERRTWGHQVPGAAVVVVSGHVAARERALAGDDVLDASSLERFLVSHCPLADTWQLESGGVTVAGTDAETYGWRLHEIVHIHEAALGTEFVAQELVQHLLRASREPDAWGFMGKDPWRHNAGPHHLAWALAPMRHRMEPRAWTDLVAPFRGIASERLLVFADLLACFADDTRAPLCPYYALDIALARRDRAAVHSLVAGNDQLFWRSEAAWLLGGAPFVGAKLGNLRRLPDWKQVRFVDEVGRLAVPEVAVAIATLASARAGRRAASGWLLEHAAFARPVIEAAATSLPDEADRERMRAALAILGSGTHVEARALTEEELDAELGALFGSLEATLEACRGDLAAERVAMRAVFDRYCDARAAAGEVMPAAYFGHELIDWRPKNVAAHDRWFELACAIQDG